MILLEGCRVVVTMDDAGTELENGSVLIDGGVISWIGQGRPPVREQPDVVDGRGLVAIPGLINTHHHLYQTLTRVHAQQGGLFDWLRELYPIWATIDAEWERTAAEVGLAELALSGCSTTTDHHYVFPSGVIGLLEAEIEVAEQLGLRFHPCRGSMDLGQSNGGLPPDRVVEDIDSILAATDAAIQRFHDPAPGSMRRIAVGPCSPFSVSERLMRESTALARRRKVRLHTHIAETLDEESYCRTTFNRRPLELLEDLGFLGPDVWLAHCVHVNDADIRRLAATATAVAWCPTSNMRLGSGFAPAREMIRQPARRGAPGFAHDQGTQGRGGDDCPPGVASGDPRRRGVPRPGRRRLDRGRQARRYRAFCHRRADASRRGGGSGRGPRLLQSGSGAAPLRRGKTRGP